MDYIYKYKSPIGSITLASDGNALMGLWFDGQKYDRDVLLLEAEEKELPIFSETCKWLDIYFSGRKPDFTPPILMRTTNFRQKVWKILLTIPYGKPMTYGDIAKKMAVQYGIQKMSAQAVGGAVGHNSISIIIPCHRVVGANGSLTGYAGGIDKKIKLLSLEKVDLSNMYVPEKGTAL